MDLGLPNKFGNCDTGMRISLVGKLILFDPAHDAHLCKAEHDGSLFHVSGLLDGTGEMFSFMNVTFMRQFPVPLIGIDEGSAILRHDAPSFASLYGVIELCSGFGGICQGMSTSGFFPVAAVDQNERMLKLYDVQNQTELIAGDVCKLSTLLQVWKVAKGAGVVAAGFACQPFSRLGDQLGGCDARAKCLPGILATAYFLRAQVVILECVQPASGNAFVESEIKRFLEISGFLCSQCDLHLQDIWPCRRSRAWWILSSPLIGKVPLVPWPRMRTISKVRQVISGIQPWDLGDENALALNLRELEVFGAHDDSFQRFLLNFETCAPCALHSWGSQVVGCECGCRLSGLSDARLADKGLFGCLVRSCQTEFHASVLRHLHPNEVMGLCAYDPLIDFGSNPRLTLAAAGQMASPLQAAWVFAALDERIQTLRTNQIQFHADARIQAYMSWIIMRCRQVWPATCEVITDSNMLSLVQFWGQVPQPSLHELMHPSRWPDLLPHELNIGSILDLIIRRTQTECMLPKPIVTPGDIPMTVIDEDVFDDQPTPWHETCHCEVPDLPAVSANECLVVFFHEYSNPIKISVTEGCTIQNLLEAHEQLVGGLKACYACDHVGNSVPFSHVLQLGQVICIRCEEGPTDVSTPSLQSETEACGAFPLVEHDVAMPAITQPKQPEHVVSPTLPHGVLEKETLPGDVGLFGPCDAGESPMPVQRLADCESWISAAPLLCLQSDQLKSLQVPVVTSTKHLWSLRHQLLNADDRLAILKNQNGVWADDEFRFHIAALLQLRNDRACACADFQFHKCFMLDPLLLSGWACHGTQLCQLWGASHPEIRSEGLMVLSACMVDGHWIPVVLTPNGKRLQFTTWDAPSHSHDVLLKVVDAIGSALGFEGVDCLRHQRIFFSSDKCGALAMAFLHHSVLHSMLPTCKEEVEVIHEGFRNAYSRTLESCQLARRPWVWGSGDAEDPGFSNEPGTSSGEGSQLVPVSHQTSFSHVCMDKDQRMDLLRNKGKLWGDDEIRFHLVHLINHKSNVCNVPFATIPGFVMIDPLMLSAWDTIGKGLCEAWCKRHPVVPDQGFHIVTVLMHSDHWFPVWGVPHGKTLVVHTIDDGVVEPSVIQPMLDVFREQFGFLDVVLHVYPRLLPDHDMCGAAAIAFLGHILVGADLPMDVESLGYMHSNMKASFVQALFEGECCICPVAWGSGGNGTLLKSLADELEKHGVPEDMSNQRAQQAIRAIGSDKVVQAMSAKNVWRSLKILGNQARFQFLLPEELAALVSKSKSIPVGKRMKQGVLKAKPPQVETVDPTKLMLPEGTFQALGRPVPQIPLKQLGPVSHGIALVSVEDALPYLKAGMPVSNEPLAIAIFPPAGVVIETSLPHTKMFIPCVCIANNEPLLTEAVVVQLGKGFVEKKTVSSAISLDQLDVVTIKVMVYKDEFPNSWDEFVTAPIKQLVKIFPILARCDVDACECGAWHNTGDLPLKDPLMDVWRRQYLQKGFKPVPALKADIFSVCLRVPSEIMLTMLAQSGASGAYTEPRTPDGKEVLPDFVVVWAAKMSQSELSHVMQTNPVVTGMARLGERRGLRVQTEHAQKVHDLLRPEAAFLPSGPKSLFVVGPFPWGSDRNAINKALRQASWNVKALQPNQPIPGRGSMWLIQAVDMPPSTIFHMAHGEVVVSKHKQSDVPKPAAVSSVGSVSTLSLCSAGVSEVPGENDPWLNADPWGAYAKGKSNVMSTPANAGLQQLEERIQTAVLAKMPSCMDDDAPARLATLETQVQQLMHKNQALEGQFTEFSHQSTKQFAVVQQQIQQQSQTFHGQLENQTQSVQAMFESQMSQIRNLLAKRPRDDDSME